MKQIITDLNRVLRVLARPPSSLFPSSSSLVWLLQTWPHQRARRHRALAAARPPTGLPIPCRLLGGRLRSLLRKRDRRKGRGRGHDHHRYPNRCFAELGLFNLEAAKKTELQPST